MRKIRISDGATVSSTSDHVDAKKKISSPLGIALAAGRLFMGDVMGASVHIFSKKSLQLEHVITMDDLPRDTKSFNPHGVDVHAGKLYVADADESFVYVFSIRGDYLYRIGSRGTDPLQFIHPRGIFILRGSALLVIERARLQLLSLDGSECLQLLVPPIPATESGEVNMFGADYDPVTGRLFVVDTWNRVHVLAVTFK